MKVIAKLNNLRISPRKVRDVADLIRGCKVDEAFYRLGNSVRRSTVSIEKLLKSAVANAQNNFGLSEDNLYISEILVDAGPTLKRWMPRAMGRATKILKRTSQIEIVLSEITEGASKTEKKETTKKASVKKEVVKTSGSKKVAKKVEAKEEVVTEENKAEHKEIVKRERQASRQPGHDKKLYKKRPNKK